MEQLPRDLSDMEVRDLAATRSAHDDRITALFRRWPALSRQELRELRQRYRDRVRIAKYVGGMRRRRASRARSAGTSDT